MKTFEEVPFPLTDDELRALGAEMAREVQVVYDLKLEKKAVAASLTLSIDEAEARVALLVRKINERHELRDVECVIRMHTPRTGVKATVRADTGEIVREAPMTAAELQEKLPFETSGSQSEDDESAPYKKRRREPNVN